MFAINLGSPEFLEFHAERLRDVLGRAWLETQLATIQKGAPDHPLFVVNGFRDLPDWLRSVREGTSPKDAARLIEFSWAAYVVSTASGYPGADRFIKALRVSAHAGCPEQFKDTLFEGETAVFWAQSMGATSVAFGPPAGNPDISVEVRIGGYNITIPVECKRIRSSSPEQDELDAFLPTMEEALRPIIDACPLKVIVWFHRQVQSNDARDIADHVRRLAAAVKEGRWVTTADPDGGFQVSIAPLGPAADWQWPGPHITDVPVEGRMMARLEIIHGKEKARVKSVISVRSDRVPCRVGNLRRRVESAIDQLRRSVDPTSCGAISIRIRPPRGLGDLFESDLIVRQVLREKGADHVGVVFLHWSEAERVTEWERTFDDGSYEREVKQGLTFQYHAIAGRQSRIDFRTIDSWSERFKHLPDALIRDPVSGELVPIAREEFHRILFGGDLNERQILEVADGRNEEEQGGATIYLRLIPEFWEKPRGLVCSLIRAGSRQFRTVIESDLHLRTIEIVNGEISSVATVDLRAWAGSEELLYYVVWKPRGFYVEIVTHDGQTRLRAASARVIEIPEWR